MSMDYRLRNALVILLLVAFGAWYARHTGWYNAYWYTDVILHIISGIAFGYAYTWLARKTIHSSRFIFVLSMIAFAAFGGVLWEFWEFSGWRIMPAHTQFYVPELGDSLGDILCGMIGAALLSIRAWYDENLQLIRLS